MDKISWRLALNVLFLLTLACGMVKADESIAPEAPELCRPNEFDPDLLKSPIYKVEPFSHVLWGLGYLVLYRHHTGQIFMVLWPAEQMWHIDMDPSENSTPYWQRDYSEECSWEQKRIIVGRKL